MILMPEEIALVVAQSTSLIATIVGIIIFVLQYRALRRLHPGVFYDSLMVSMVFTLFILLGVISMTIYHIAHGMNGFLSEFSETTWYVFMFLGLLISCFESFELMKFSKYFRELETKLSFVKAKWQSKR